MTNLWKIAYRAQPTQLLLFARHPQHASSQNPVFSQKINMSELFCTEMRNKAKTWRKDLLGRCDQQGSSVLQREL